MFLVQFATTTTTKPFSPKQFLVQFAARKNLDQDRTHQLFAFLF